MYFNSDIRAVYMEKLTQPSHQVDYFLPCLAYYNSHENRMKNTTYYHFIFSNIGIVCWLCGERRHTRIKCPQRHSVREGSKGRAVVFNNCRFDKLTM